MKVAKVVGVDKLKYYNIVNLTLATGHSIHENKNKQRIRKLKGTI